MRYTVVYLSPAEEKLADIWTHAGNRQAVTRAANQIDRLLKFSAERQGEEHPEGRRLVVEPLAVVFRVLPDDRLVQVIEVEYLGS
jgi:plasmid stabilization system protein ParE